MIIIALFQNSQSINKKTLKVVKKFKFIKDIDYFNLVSKFVIDILISYFHVKSH